MILCVTLNPCVDKTVYVDRLKVGQIQGASKSTVTVGGKANNVARVLASYGREAVAMNFLGGETGRLCHRLIEEEDQVRAETIWTKSATREIITIYETQPNVHTDIKEPNAVITGDERDEFLARYRTLLPSAEWVSYGGSAPSESVDDLPALMCGLAREAGVPFVLDTYGKALALGLDQGPWMVKPNRAEAQALFGKTLDSDAALESALDWLAARARFAVLSLGEEGFLAAYEGQRYRVRSPKVRTVDAVGSGDALVAGIIVGFGERLPLEETLALAAAAGAANAASPLACRLRPEDVEPLISQARVEKFG